MNTLKNRAGDQYWFEEVEPNVYTIRGDLKYWRYGGKDGQRGIDFNDLGFVDPSGGPFIDIGTRVNDKYVTKISIENGTDTILLYTEKSK